MAREGSVVVIGAGVVGVSAAYCLRLRGWDVVLLDKGEVCSGASYGNAGFVLPSHAVPLAAPGVMGKGLRWLMDPESPFYIRPRLDRELISWLLRFAASSTRAHVQRSAPVLLAMHRASQELYQEWVSKEGLDCDFTRKGLMALCRTASGYHEVLEEARFLGSLGVTFEALDGKAACDLEPAIRPGMTGGVYYPEDAHVTPGKFVSGLAAAAERMGVAIKTNTEVLGFVTAGEKVAAVQTTRGDFRADEVVLAAGAWSPPVARGLGLRLPIQAAKGYSVTTKRPALSPSISLLLGEARVGVTPMGELLRIAGTLELAGLDLSINRRRVDAIVSGARAYVSGLDDMEPVEIWRGLRPCTPDGLPIIGRAGRYRNLTVAAGHAMVGQSLGPITGKIVSQILCGEDPAIAIAPFRAERFQ
ncbi:MAG: FAD-dependent oxidoreductase [Armatimonadetes bacterium]|nr:FAD-dependent oxidoreductase [Armatimonadota bacterium]